MTEAIEIKELPAAKAVEVILPIAKAQGWMAWAGTATGESIYWMQVHAPFEPSGQRDPYRCPYPLFMSREDALSACAKALPNGGQCRIVKIEL